MSSPVTYARKSDLVTMVNHRTKTTSVVHTLESAKAVVIDESELKPLSDQLKIIIEARVEKLGWDASRIATLFQEICHIANIKYKSTKTQKKKKKTDVQKEETKRKRAIFDESIEQNKENDFDESSQGWKRVRGNYGEILFNNRLMISEKNYEDYFFTFEEAVARADEIDCCSITKTQHGYSLRGDMIPVKIGISKTGKGKGILSHPERSIASWTKLPIGWILPHPTHIAVKDSRVAQKYELANEKYMRKTERYPPVVPSAAKEAADAAAKEAADAAAKEATDAAAKEAADAAAKEAADAAAKEAADDFKRTTEKLEKANKLATEQRETAERALIEATKTENETHAESAFLFVEKKKDYEEKMKAQQVARTKPKTAPTKQIPAVATKPIPAVATKPIPAVATKPIPAVPGEEQKSKYPESEMETVDIERDDGVHVEMMYHEESGDVFEMSNLLEPVGEVDDGEIMLF